MDENTKEVLQTLLFVVFLLGFYYIMFGDNKK